MALPRIEMHGKGKATPGAARHRQCMATQEQSSVWQSKGNATNSKAKYNQTGEAMEDRKYRLTFTEPLLGGAPKNARIYRDYVASKAPEPENEGVQEEEMVDAGEKGMTGFLRDSEGIYLMDYQV